ncbi:MAG: ROK family transcriptional regulator [Gemmatimonadota bacterium]
MRKINTRSFVRATRSTPREVNRQILLNLVREHEPISRADLSRRMEIARGMVTSLVDELIEDGSLYEGATVDSPRGRRPQMLFVRTRGRLVISIDVRFSRTYVMLGDFSGTAIALETFETIEDPMALVAELKLRVRRLLATHGDAGTCEGLGLVVPGMVDSVTGRVLNAPHLGWRNVDIVDALSDAVGLPVFVENAPIACALALMWLGQRGGGELTDFVYVNVSDGVGTGVVVNGQVLRGMRNTAGEFGHVPLSADGPPCHCGGRGCLEAYSSDLATLVRYLGHEFSPLTARTLVQASGLTIADIIALAESGNERAIRAIEETAKYLGAGLANIINTLSPSQICIGGEISEAWGLIEPIMRGIIAARALTDIAAATPLVAEKAPSQARLRGATTLVAAPRFAAPKIA